MKKILIVKNITHEGPGLIQNILNNWGLSFNILDLSQGGAWPELTGYSTLIVLGGPESANDTTEKIQTEINQIKEWLKTEKPFLGICLGMQLLAKAAGSEIMKSPAKEVGFLDPEGKRFEVRLTLEGREDPLFRKLGDRFPVFQLHRETVRLTDEMTLLATGRFCPYQVVKVGKAAYGIQCHFELTHEMLMDWASHDTDLEALDQDELSRQYRAFEKQYRETGRRLFENFFDRIE